MTKIFMVEWVERGHEDRGEIMGMFSTTDNATEFVNQAIARFNQAVNSMDIDEEDGDIWYNVKAGSYVISAHELDNMLKW